MHIIRVIPITKSISKEELSYFSSVPYEAGSLIKIPLRKKQIYGIVRGYTPVSDMKAEVKDAPFEMRRLPAHTKPITLLSRAFTKAATELSLYVAHPFGSVIDGIIPRKIYDHAATIPPSLMQPGKHGALPEKLVFQEDTEKRADHYRALVRESFARGQSIFILVPHKTDGSRLKTMLEKGIEDYLFDFSRTISESDLVDMYKRARTEPHPIVLIGTGKFLSVDRHDLGTIIIERESNRAYKSITRPYIDYRIWAEIYARTIGARLILADNLLRVETIGRLHRHELHEHTQIKRRLTLPPHIHCIDTRTKIEGIVKDLPALSETMQQAVVAAYERGEKMFILSARTGLSPVTYCRDCGTMVTCHICNAAMVLHTSRQGNFFLCHKCGERKSAHTTCTTCNGWHLEAFGSGIEKVAQELATLVPPAQIVRLDKDTAPTNLKAKDQIAVWQKHGTILVGTERAIPFINEAGLTCDTSGIASIDALFSIPDFRMYEKIFGLIAHIGTFTKQTLLIDTRNPDHPLFSALVRNDLMSFYRSELSLRKTLSYPPESIFIKISLSGQKDAVTKEMEDFATTLPAIERVLFPALVRKKNLYTMHILIKVPWETWPDTTISHILSALPPRFSVKIDPDSLLS